MQLLPQLVLHNEEMDLRQALKHVMTAIQQMEMAEREIVPLLRLAGSAQAGVQLQQIPAHSVVQDSTKIMQPILRIVSLSEVMALKLAQKPEMMEML